MRKVSLEQVPASSKPWPLITKLNEKKYQRFKEGRRTVKLFFEEGFSKYKPISTHLRGNRTQELNDIDQDHIVEYRSFLLAGAKMRETSEESFRKKYSRIKDPEVFNEMKKTWT